MPDTPVNLEERDRKVRRLYSAVLANLPTGLSDEQLSLLNGNLEEVGRVVNGAILGLLPTPTGEGWIDQLVARDGQRLRNFFGQTFDMTVMVNALEVYGREKVEWWHSLGLAVGYLPAVTLTPKTKLRKWRTRPEAWFWEKLNEGKLYRRNVAGELVKLTEVGLEGVVVLYDTRQKPDYDNARQMYTNDETFMAPIIAKLRKEGKIQSHQDVPQGSRFYISSNEWDQHLRATVAEFLGLEVTQVRLETEIEANVIPQLYGDTPRSKDGTTNTWEWREEFFGGASSRLLGGLSDFGGLARVSSRDVARAWYNGAVRPVGVLATRTV